MTFRMKPEYDRKGRVSASAGSGMSGATIIRLPTDTKLGFTCLKSSGSSRTLPLIQKGNQGEGDVALRANKMCSPRRSFPRSLLWQGPYTVILWAEVSKIEECECAFTGPPSGLHNCLRVLPTVCAGGRCRPPISGCRPALIYLNPR